MNTLQQIMEHNQNFVVSGAYKQFQTDKFPDKKLVIVSCMDTRLTELLPRALNLKNGDAKIIKIAGGVISHPFGSVMRSIMVAVYELGAEEVCLIGHHGCGMASIDPKTTMSRMVDRGIPEDRINMLENAGIDLTQWLHGFACVEEAVSENVKMIRNHPLLPSDVRVHGLVVDPETGKLDIIVDGYQEGN
ncbi:carbonic anhydrase [Paenibacillus turpanensis]|uniref:carbonic anhydrase n=1 Tax=Paenibacillus turpanensis TaxID=2689078 RepID=UPI0014072C49